MDAGFRLRYPVRMLKMIAGALLLTTVPASAATLTVFEMTGAQADRIGRAPADMVPQLLEQQARNGLAQGSSVEIIPDGEDHVDSLDRSLPGVAFIDSRRQTLVKTESTGNLMQLWHAGTRQAGIHASVRILRQSGFADFSGKVSGPVTETKADGSFVMNDQPQAAVSYAPASGSRGAQTIVLLYKP